jgi:hypothetical protein
MARTVRALPRRVAPVAPKTSTARPSPAAARRHGSCPPTAWRKAHQRGSQGGVITPAGSTNGSGSLRAGRQVPEDTVMSNSLEPLTVDAFQPRVGETFRIRAACRRANRRTGVFQETDVTNRNDQFSVVNPRQLPPSRPPRQALWHAAREPKLAVDRRHAGVTFVLQSSARVE